MMCGVTRVGLVLVALTLLLLGDGDGRGGEVGGGEGVGQRVGWEADGAGMFDRDERDVRYSKWRYKITETKRRRPYGRRRQQGPATTAAPHGARGRRPHYGAVSKTAAGGLNEGRVTGGSPHHGRTSSGVRDGRPRTPVRGRRPHHGRTSASGKESTTLRIATKYTDRYKNWLGLVYGESLDESCFMDHFCIVFRHSFMFTQVFSHRMIRKATE